MTEPRSTQQSGPFSADTKAAVVRYQVKDVERALAFVQRSDAVIAIIARGNLHLILSGPGSSGSRPMSDGRQQEPGGWNRIVLYVENLASTIASLETAGTRFRNQVEVGPGGKQIQVDDPDGNPMELHEAPGK